MDESVIKQLEQEQVGMSKLSAAIRRGKPLVGDESRASYKLCALGCAWAGVRGKVIDHDDVSHICGVAITRHLPISKAIAAILGFDEELGGRVNEMHLGGMPALEIAAEARGAGLLSGMR